MIPKPIDASTVILIKESSREPFQVLMVKRTKKSNFASGAYVFPGGALDPEDFDPATLSLITKMPQIPIENQMTALDHNIKMGLFICAIRETFEETGILISTEPDKTDQSRLLEYQSRLNSNQLTFKDILIRENMTINLENIFLFSNWITPETAPKRFNARFFLTIVKDLNDVSIQEAELSKSIWISPEQALSEYSKGNFHMIFPTIKNLMELSQFENINELLEEAKSRIVNPILPKVILKEGKLFLRINNDTDPIEIRQDMIEK